MNSSQELRVYGKLDEWSQFDIVTLHPLADQTSLLKQLEVEARNCTHCDLYWVCMGFLIFVGISSGVTAKVTYYRKQDLEHGQTFNVITSVCPLDTQSVENALRFLSSWIERNQSVVKADVKELVLVTEEDICGQ